MPAKRVVLAEYFTTEELTLLFIVRAELDEPRVYEIKQPIEEVRQFIVQNFGAERTREGVVTVRPGDKVRHLDETAYQNLFGPFVDPIREWADEGDIVWLVPHDMLHYLPLHALKVEGRYLIERNPVCYTPSASVMKYCHAKRKGRRERALILADSRADLPLLHAREQALAIQELFDPQAEVYINGAATKTLVKQRLTEARDDIDVLHFACHGYFHPDQALRSGIMLAPEDDSPIQEEEPQRIERPEESPWNLTAEEIFGLEMKADLVTLSACESGVNERRPGDELIGLTRALIYAGTPSVVVSLWSVDEISTSILMGTFYQALKDGSGKAEALQQAQLRVKDLTARQAIALCQEAKARFTSAEGAWGRNLLDEDIARLRYLAGDFAGARADYQALRQRLPTESREAREIEVRITQCELAGSVGGKADYERKVYAHPYYWSPFVLVGDWK